MKTKVYIFCLFAIILLCFAGCGRYPDAHDATDYGLGSHNSGEENSRALQALIDKLSDEGGGTIFIPKGEYEFAANGQQTIGSHCIKMRSNVSIIGVGEKTVLKPVGESYYGLDMFYFNDYLDTGNAEYLENCNFERFVIDGAGTSCKVYTSAGKGFMFNLFRNCHWKDVTVKDTDATGFGVDCPVDSTIKRCVAINCGKAATEESSGASGFGIGYGYSADEGMTISKCQAYGNTKFGFFFEHQGRFDSDMYTAYNTRGFFVYDCEGGDNLYDFGGICAEGVRYSSCKSDGGRQVGFYLEDSSAEINDCKVKNSSVAIKVISKNERYPIDDVVVSKCSFVGITEYDVFADGEIACLVLEKNRSSLNKLYLSDNIDNRENKENSWN